MTTPIRIAIVGASGYSGAELVRLLAGHPAAELVGLFGGRQRTGAAGSELLSDLCPGLRGVADLPVHAAEVPAIQALAPDAVFLATPHDASMELAAPLCAQGVVVFDLSGAFRLKDPEVHARHYGIRHGAGHGVRKSAGHGAGTSSNHAPAERPAELAARAVYGLPELNAAAIARASLIACPGCYPTSVILPLRPLVAEGVIDAAHPVIVDSASGVSGAGRTPALKSLFCEVSFQPYAVLAHRHQPEMAQETGARILFTPHLAPLHRGILSTIHAQLASGCTLSDAYTALQRAYAGAPFVRLLPPGQWPSVAAVERTNCCDISLGTDETGTHLVACSAIDNLVKGAAGQAVQCFNLRFGLPQTTGLGPVHRLHAHASPATPTAPILQEVAQ